MMFDREIVSLHRQGLTSGTIARHLGLDPTHVRRVLNTQCVAEAKPIDGPVRDEWRKQRTAEIAPEETKRRTAARAKRKRAQAALEKARAALDELD